MSCLISVTLVVLQGDWAIIVVIIGAIIVAIIGAISHFTELILYLIIILVIKLLM
jgi:hypothetical protein